MIVLLAALATAVLGVLTAHLRGGRSVVAGERTAGEVAGDPSSAPSADAPSEELGRLEGEVEALRDDLRRARDEAAESQQLRVELEAARAQFVERIATLESGLGAVRQQIGGPEPGPGEVDASPAPQAEERAATGDVTQAQPAEEPLDARRARAFERVMADLRSGRASEGLRRVEALGAEGLFSASDPAGFDLLAALTEGWLALEGAELAGRAAQGLPDPDRLTEAARHLRRAEQLREGFDAAAGDWLASGGPPSPAHERLSRVDRSLTQLAQRLDATAASAQALHDQDWRWILELGVPQAPELVSRHAARFGCDHDATLLASTVDAWTARCVRSGEIDPLELASAQHLRAWGSRTLERPLEQRSAKENEILWLWYALRWYVDADAPVSFDWRGLDVPEVLAPREDWRAELRLAVELALPGAGWPPPVGRSAIYHLDTTGPARWRLDEVVQVDPDGSRWRLVRRHFDDDGVPLGGGVEVFVERDEQRFSYAGSQVALVDLRACGPTVSLAPCPVAVPRTLPAFQGVDLRDVESLVLGAGTAVGACLVQRDGEWTRWLAPGLGLVREEREGPDGRVRIELCAVSSAP